MNKPCAPVHAHPFSVVMYLYRFLFLLIVPIIRGFLSALTGDLVSWLSGAWLDVLILCLIILLSYEKWEHFKYYMDNRGIWFTSGIFFRRKTLIPMHQISTLSTLKLVWLRPFGVVKLRVDTIAQGNKKADIEFYISTSEAERILQFRRGQAVKRGNVAAAYRPPILSIVFLSLFTSNSFLGILLIATFISQAGQIVGEELTSLLISTFEQLSRQFAIGISPFAAGVAIALLVGWLAAFTLNLLQTKNLITHRTQDTIHIHGGVYVQKEYSLLSKDISFIDIRQSLLTRFLRLYSVFINAIGFNKDKSDITAIIPFSTKGRAFAKLKLLLPEFKVTERTLKPNAGALFKFILEPLWPCALIPLATMTAIHFLPSWNDIIRFSGFMLSLPAFWFLGVRIMDFMSSGVSRKDNFYTLRYSRRFYLHTVVFSYDKIALINIRQSILQRGDNKCDLVVSTRAEGRIRHHIRNLDWDACVKIFNAEDKKS